MADLAFTAVSSVRKAVNTSSVTRKARIVVMRICPSFLFPSDTISQFFYLLCLIPLFLC